MYRINSQQYRKLLTEKVAASDACDCTDERYKSIDTEWYLIIDLNYVTYGTFTCETHGKGNCF